MDDDIEPTGGGNGVYTGLAFVLSVVLTTILYVFSMIPSPN